ncbi:MAG: hypothetical protein HYX83_03435 [Chloroflexi bacterium]|nr:hypothetical protein [Chloroflexota bacterium]
MKQPPGVKEGAAPVPVPGGATTQEAAKVATNALESKGAAGQTNWPLWAGVAAGIVIIVAATGLILWRKRSY